MKRKPAHGGRPAADIARDVDEELAAHLEMRQHEYEAEQGLAPDDAREAARRRFGDVGRVAAVCQGIDHRFYKEQRRMRMWRDLRQDVKYALRSLRRTPAFTAAAVLTLALGLGATTAIFSLANWTLLRPVPGVRDPGNVRFIWTGTWNTATSFGVSGVSYPNYADIVQRLHTIELAGLQGGGPLSVATSTRPARHVEGEFVTSSFFGVLGVRMQAGRPFTPEEDNPGAAARVAVISDRLWASLFDRSPAALEESVWINGHVFTIVGVTAAGFHGPQRVSNIDLWIPGATLPLVNYFEGVSYDNRTQGRYYEFVARLKPGASWMQAESEIQSLAPWLAQLHPDANDKFHRVGFHLLGPIGVGPHPGVGRQISRLLTLMMIAAAVVLLIACANVSGLLLMRGLTRTGEVAIRIAIGAGRFRLLRQYLTEGAVLWLLGGAAAAAVVWSLSGLVEGSTVLGRRMPDARVTIDWRVLTFAVVLSFGVGLLFSIVPAARTTRVQPAEPLRRTSASITRPGFGTGTVLVVVQLAASLALFVGALLLAGTVRHLSTVAVGFDAARVAVLFLDPMSVGYDAARAYAYYQQFAQQLAARPQIHAVSAASGVPFLNTSSTRVRVPGGTGSDEVLRPDVVSVFLPGYFETVGIAMLRGRPFSDADLGTPARPARPVVVVSETLAHLLFGTADPIGREVEFPIMGRSGARYEIIGVAADVRFSSLTDEVEPVLYEPAEVSKDLRSSNMLVVRTSAPIDLGAEARAIAASLDSSLPVGRVMPLTDAIGRTRAEWDLLARLFGGLAGIAVLLSAIGLYGVVGFGVEARRREFGIRIALGASTARVRALVLRRTTFIAGGGLVLGLGGAAALVRMLESRLVGVQPSDPLLWAIAAAGLVLVALLASLIPVRRATRVDVTAALRDL